MDGKKEKFLEFCRIVACRNRGRRTPMGWGGGGAHCLRCVQSLARFADDRLLWRGFFKQREALTGVEHIRPGEAAGERQREGLPDTWKTAVLRPVLRITLHLKRAGLIASSAKKAPAGLKFIGERTVDADDGEYLNLIRIPSINIEATIDGTSSWSLGCRSPLQEPGCASCTIYSIDKRHRPYHAFFLDSLNPTAQATWSGFGNPLADYTPLAQPGDETDGSLWFIDTQGQPQTGVTRNYCAAAIFDREYLTWSCTLLAPADPVQTCTFAITTFSRENGRQISEVLVEDHAQLLRTIRCCMVAWPLGASRAAFVGETGRSLHIWNHKGKYLSSEQLPFPVTQCIKGRGCSFLSGNGWVQPVLQTGRDFSFRTFAFLPPFQAHSAGGRGSMKMALTQSGLVTGGWDEDQNSDPFVPGRVVRNLRFWQNQRLHSSLQVTQFKHSEECPPGLEAVGSLIFTLDRDDLVVWDPVSTIICARHQLRPNPDLVAVRPIRSAVLVLYESHVSPGGGLHAIAFEIPSLPSPENVAE